MQVAIHLPSDFVEMQTAGVIEREMRVSYALALFKAAREWVVLNISFLTFNL